MTSILSKSTFLKLLFKFIADTYTETRERAEKDTKFSCSHLFSKYVTGSR